MIDFIIIKKEKSKGTGRSGWNSVKLNNNWDLYHKRNFVINNKQNNHYILIIGDCVNPELLEKIDPDHVDQTLKKLKGNFYIIINTASITIASSNFGLLPIYYTEDFGCISSSIKNILLFTGEKKGIEYNRSFLLNLLLFNYQFNDGTYIRRIKSFPCFSYLSLNNSTPAFIKYFNVSDHFLYEPRPWKKAIDDLSILFIDNLKRYFPDGKNAMSFTGGFDSRTLVAAGIYHRKNFGTFSYGKQNNDDITIPKKNALKLNIEYEPLLLEEDYQENEFFKSAVNYIENTSGANGFLYAHIDFSGRFLSSKYSFLTSGVCGSELFRAIHSSGALTSRALLSLFSASSKKDYYKNVISSSVFKFIDLNKLQNEMDEIIDLTWSYREKMPKELSVNQKLYVFLVEEVFRKLFGAWTCDQMQYLKVRTPFLDMDFLVELLKSELSGAYCDFMTENPLKRFKGQLFYADVIGKTNPVIFKQITGKGYSPEMVLNQMYRYKLILPFLTHRLRRKLERINLDNLSIISGIQKNFDKIIDEEIFEDYIKTDVVRNELEAISPFIKEENRDILLGIVSFQHLRTKNSIH